MYESPYDNYSVFEEREREIERLNKLNRRISHEYGCRKENLNGAGYTEINSGIFVPEEDAYKYAMERISQDEDLKRELVEMVVEWFYSGNWIKEE